MQVHVLSLLNLLICPYLGCVTEAGKWRIGGQGLTVMSGWRVSGDWVSCLHSWSWSWGLGSGPGSHPGSSRLSRRFGWNFHWRKPRASRGEPGPSRAEPLADSAGLAQALLRTKKWLCSALSSASAGLSSAGGAHADAGAYKTSKNPGQVFTCEAAKPG